MLKIVFKSIIKNPISNIIIIIQIASMLFLFNNSYDSFFIVNKQEKIINNILGDNKDSILRLKIDYRLPSNETDKYLWEIDNNIRNMNLVGFSGGLDTTTLEFKELSSNKEYNNMIKSTPEYEGTTRAQYSNISDVILMDKGIHKLLNLDLAEGRNFNDEDYNWEEGKSIPVILGSSYRSILKIGDILTEDMFSKSGPLGKDEKFEVVGFLKDDFTTLDYDNDYIQSTPIKLNTYILIPTTSEFNVFSPHLNCKMDNYFIYAKNKGDIDNIKENVRQCMTKGGISYNLYTYDEELAKFKDENKSMINLSLFLIIFIFIMAVFSLVSSLLFSIEKRKQNIGIQIANGASMRYIKATIFLETIVVWCIGFFISIISIIINKSIYYINFLKQPFKLRYAFNGSFLLVVFGGILVFSIVSSFIPLRKIDKLEVKDIIGGNE